MKNNYITLKDKKGQKKEYRIILDIKDTSSNLNYVIYTDEKKDKNGSVIAYASSYVLSDKGNMTKLHALNDSKEFEFIENILSSLETNN